MRSDGVHKNMVSKNPTLRENECNAS